MLAQHVLGCACGEPFLSDELYAEVLTAAPYSSLTRRDFDDVVDFVATGGYALKTYERFARIKQDKQGRWRVANPRVRQSYRLNVGTIVEDTMLKVRLVRSRGGGSGSTGAIARGGRMLGEIEEAFIEGLVLGDTFVFGGEVVRYEALVEDQVYVSRANDKDAKVPSYMGGKFPLSTYLAERVRKLLDDRRAWNGLPDQVRDWLSLQKRCFPRAGGARAAGGNLSARQQALSRLLSLRGTAGAPDARHAADAAAWSARGCGRSALSPMNMRWRSGGSATCRP